MGCVPCRVGGARVRGVDGCGGWTGAGCVLVQGGGTQVWGLHRMRGVYWCRVWGAAQVCVQGVGGCAGAGCVPMRGALVRGGGACRSSLKQTFGVVWCGEQWKSSPTSNERVKAGNLQIFSRACAKRSSTLQICICVERCKPPPPRLRSRLLWRPPPPP